MSITATTSRIGPYVMAAFPQACPSGFTFQQASDLLVINAGQTSAPRDPATVLILGSDYTVTGGGYNGSNQMQTGTVTIQTGGAGACIVGDVIWILRNVSQNQIASATSAVLTTVLLEEALDKTATIDQQLQEQINRSLRFENFETLSGTLPLVSRKNSVMGFDLNGNPQFLPVTGYTQAAPIASISALSAISVLTVTTNTIVNVLGYYTPADGGGGYFYYSATSTATVDGGSVVSALGGVGRWIRLFYGPVSAAYFGCVGDAATDNATRIANLLTFAQSTSCPSRTVVFPVGSYNSSATFTITVPIKIIGESEAFYSTALPNAVGSTLTYVGGATGNAFFKFYNCHMGSFGMESLEVNASNLAANALFIDSCFGGYFKDLYPHGGTVDSLSITCTTTTTNSWHTFINLNIDDFYITGGRSCLRLGGPVGLGNACHCQFINTRINHNDVRNAIVLAGCDNIKFDMTYIFRGPPGTGKGVLIDPTEQAGFPGENMFNLLEAGDGGWSQPVGTTSMPAVIYGYQQGNGQPVPVTNSTPLFWQDNIGSAHFNTNSQNFIGASGSAQVVAINGNSTFGVGWQALNASPAVTWTYVVDSAGGWTVQRGGTEAFFMGRSGATTAHFDWLVESDLGFSATVAGKTLSVKSGSNASAGTVTLAAGVGTISSTAITANSVVMLTRKTTSGAATALLTTCSAGSCAIAGAGTDNGTYNWVNLLVN